MANENENDAASDELQPSQPERRTDEETLNRSIIEQQENTSRYTQEMLLITNLDCRKKDRNRLSGLLAEISQQGKLHPNPPCSIYDDKSEIERRTGIKLDKEFAYMDRAFRAHFTGTYRSDAVRREFLIRKIEEAKEEAAYGSVEEQASWWARFYFEGWDLEAVDIPTPENQDSDLVLQVLDEDFTFVNSLPLPSDARAEIIRSISVFFVGGQYPIILGMHTDPVSQAALAERTAEVARHSEEQIPIDRKNFRISSFLQRYRRCLAQGLDFETEELKREAETLAIQQAHVQRAEQAREEFQTELAFLESLQLPEWEAVDWPQLLLRTAQGPFFRLNPAYRERAHAHVRQLLEAFAGSDQYETETLGLVGNFLHDFWIGQYYPDQLRWMALQNEIVRLQNAGFDRGDKSHFVRHKAFIEGARTDIAQQLLRQDIIDTGRAYQQDIEILLASGFSEKKSLRVRGEYHKWLLEGKLCIAADRETPDDRHTLRQKFIDMRSANQLENMPSFEIVHVFFDYWTAIAKRPAPKKE